MGLINPISSHSTREKEKEKEKERKRKKEGKKEREIRLNRRHFGEISRYKIVLYLIIFVLSITLHI
ncbi:hypothetical protein RchiOBHm_Chr2g0150671 [Rosa chinensis]|uniref:Uncharacterized protein n=1 Tax=Rosa chinensis TaxID=74649 RepID=A0A2P6S021_ROSCH|nr:hypothetical protein RchiOBHm_Chr2g0150671 [Rosa chinensis]